MFNEDYGRPKRPVAVHACGEEIRAVRKSVEPATPARPAGAVSVIAVFMRVPRPIRIATTHPRRPNTATLTLVSHRAAVDRIGRPARERRTPLCTVATGYDSFSLRRHLD